MSVLSRRQLVLLVLITVVWGFNWPMLKLGVSQFPPLSFRSLSMWMGLPFLALVLYVKKVPFRISRADWKELIMLATTINRLQQRLTALRLPSA